MELSQWHHVVFLFEGASEGGMDCGNRAGQLMCAGYAAAGCADIVCVDLSGTVAAIYSTISPYTIVQSVFRTVLGQASSGGILYCRVGGEEWGTDCGNRAGIQLRAAPLASSATLQARLPPSISLYLRLLL